MKILVTLFEIQDYGGIAQSHELMMKGLMAVGHECTFVILRPNDRDPYTRKAEGPAGSYPSVMGGEVNTLSGWYGQLVMSYGSAKRIKMWKHVANAHDLIIHQIPVPKPDAGGWWKKLYDVDPPQIAWVHDANFRDQYPHLALVAHRLVGVTASNQAGYASLSLLPVPRAFLGVPHELEKWGALMPWERRKKQAVCAHVWKAWKRMHLVVDALPHVRRSRGRVIMGGDGIEGRYMRSKDKCKPRYKGMWKRALAAGMDYRGLMTHDELFHLYKKSRVMIDLSFSQKFAVLGSHFNRSLLEAYNCGLVPVVTGVNMEDAFQAQKTLWEHGVTHIGVHVGAHAEEIASVIEDAMNMHKDDAGGIVSRGRRILVDHFDYRKFTMDLVRLSRGESCGVYPELETGIATPEFLRHAKKFVKEKAK